MRVFETREALLALKHRFGEIDEKNIAVPLAGQILHRLVADSFHIDVDAIHVIALMRRPEGDIRNGSLNVILEEPVLAGIAEDHSVHERETVQEEAARTLVVGHEPGEDELVAFVGGAIHDAVDHRQIIDVVAEASFLEDDAHVDDSRARIDAGGALRRSIIEGPHGIENLDLDFLREFLFSGQHIAYGCFRDPGVFRNVINRRSRHSTPP